MRSGSSSNTSDPVQKRKDHILEILNPSPFPRGGYVTLSWKDIHNATGYEPEEIELYQGSNIIPFFQVDQIIPENPSRDTLSFFLADPVKPGDEHYSTTSGTVKIIKKEEPGKSETQRRTFEQKQNIEIANDNLVAWFNLTPKPGSGMGFWYAGASTSVRLKKLEGMEFLDYNYALIHGPYGHDPEKRCAQLESIEISHPSPQPEYYMRINLFNQPYRLVSALYGLVKDTIALASTPFYYNYWSDDILQPIPLRCELFRVFSLYKERDYIIEELFIETRSLDDQSDIKDFDLFFTAQYFNYMDMGSVHIIRFEDVPDWFAIGNLASPYYGYGFATDAHVHNILNPHPNYLKPGKERTFSWTLHPCKSAKSLHLFSRYKPPTYDLQPGEKYYGPTKEEPDQARRWFEEQTGHAWYESIYKPLVARLATTGKGEPYGSR